MPETDPQPDRRRRKVEPDLAPASASTPAPAQNPAGDPTTQSTSAGPSANHTSATGGRSVAERATSDR